VTASLKRVARRRSRRRPSSQTASVTPASDEIAPAACLLLYHDLWPTGVTALGAHPPAHRDDHAFAPNDRRLRGTLATRRRLAAGCLMASGSHRTGDVCASPRHSSACCPCRAPAVVVPTSQRRARGIRARRTQLLSPPLHPQVERRPYLCRDHAVSARCEVDVVARHGATRGC